jgi:glycosyltransferase involved in cell wall biosynthesis
LSYTDIIDLYNSHDISIQVSKHEGLGLGFYESLSMKIPVITLDTPPHNEIIQNDINGWIIPCHYKKMTDNKDALLESAYFNPCDLANKLLEIYENKTQNLEKISKSLVDDYHERLSIDIFRDKFINSLN